MLWVSMAERRAVARIKEATDAGVLAQPFSPEDVDNLLGTSVASRFLQFYEAGNRWANPEFFIRVSSRPEPDLYFIAVRDDMRDFCYYYPKMWQRFLTGFLCLVARPFMRD